MVEVDNEIVEARKKYFDTLNEKNIIDHTRIDELDLDNIGLVLNYQQVDLINIALSSNKVSYKEYQNKLVKFNDVITEKGQRDRYMLVLKELIADKELPIKTKEVVTKIYEQTKTNPNIKATTIEDVLNKLISKLSTDLQDLVYHKLNKLGRVEKEGIRDMSFEEALKLFNYISKDYTSITILEEANLNSFVNPNGSYNKDDLKTILDFAYENDKEVIIGSLIGNKLPNYLKEMPKELVKQRLLNYIDEVTRYISVYNSTHKRVDRKPVIRSVNAFYRLNGNPFLKVLSVEDLCDIIMIARKNLPDTLFSYDETDLEILNNRYLLISQMNEIMKFNQANKVKLVDVVGAQMHVDLDVTKSDIIKMFEDLTTFELPIAITEFDVCPTEFMLINNSHKEIEILRDRFISDFCNVLTNLNLSKIVVFDSITIDSISDNQSPRLTLINASRRINKEPVFRTLYCGMYDTNMDKKEEKFRIRNKDKKNNKGFADTLYVGIIVLGLSVVVAVVIFIFLKYR